MLLNMIVNILQDEDVIAQLEAQMAGLSVTKGTSKLAQSLKDGSANVQGQERKIKKAARRTEAGKAQNEQAE